MAADPESTEMFSSESSPAPRTLKAALNPAQRLQELLRREAELAREAAELASETVATSTTDRGAADERQAPHPSSNGGRPAIGGDAATAGTEIMAMEIAVTEAALLIADTEVAEARERACDAPLDDSVPPAPARHAEAAKSPSTPAEDPEAPAPAPAISPAPHMNGRVPATVRRDPPESSNALWKQEAVTLIVVVNSERNTPVEYPSLDALPTVTSLEEAHGAFLLSDEWQRRGPTLTRIVRLRRRRR